MKILTEVDLDNDELRAMARDLGRSKGAVDREEAKIYLAELVAHDLDGLVCDKLPDPRLDRREGENRRGRQECVCERGERVIVAKSWGQQKLEEAGGSKRGRPRQLRDASVLAKPKALPSGLRTR